MNTQSATLRQQVLFVARVAMLMAVCAYSTAFAAFTLKDISIHPDSTDPRSVVVTLTFSQEPISFPVYGMTDPERIVIDLVDTKTEGGLSSAVPDVPFISDLMLNHAELDGVSNARIEVFLKETVHYTAFIDGKTIRLVLKPASKVKRKVPVLSNGKKSPMHISITAIDIRELEKTMEVDVSFSSVPRTASIYLLDSPHRIVMDFNNVFVEKAFQSAMNLPPVKGVTVIKRDSEPPYAGVIVNLKEEVPFQYEQVDNRIVVSIGWEAAQRKALSMKHKIMLIGTGVVVAGGVITGILVSGDEDPSGEPGTSTGGEDLGTPPVFPEY